MQLGKSTTTSTTHNCANNQDEKNDDDAKCNESLSDDRNNKANPRVPLSKWSDLIVDIYKTLLVQSQNENEQSGGPSGGGGGGKQKSKSLRSASNMNITGGGATSTIIDPETTTTAHADRGIDLLSNGDPKERYDLMLNDPAYQKQMAHIKVDK